MKWKGETEAQWDARVSNWHRILCLVPRQMRNGNWLWLENCWAKRLNRNGWFIWEYSDSVSAPEDFQPKTPPPPHGASSGGRKTR